MNVSSIPCAVVAADAALRASVIQLLGQPGSPAELVSEIATSVGSIDRVSGEALHRSDAQLVFLEIGSDTEAALRYLRYLSQADMLRTFVLAGPPVESSVLLEAMKLGVAEYVPLPADTGALEDAIARALRRCASAQPDAAKPPQRGLIYSVFSAKGGAGATTIAANLAVELRRATGKATLLVDLDIEFGGAALTLGLRPRYTVFDAIRGLHRLDDNLLSSLLEHHESDIEVLASPATPNAGEPLTREQVRTLLEFVRRRFDFVVVDMPRMVNAAALTLFELADELFLVTTPDLPALRNTKKVLPLLNGTANGRRVRVLLNRATSDDVITAADARGALGVPLYWTLPGDDPAVAVASASGTPVGDAGKRSRYASEMQRMVRTLGVMNPAHMNGNGRHGIGGVLAGLRRFTMRSARPVSEANDHG